MMSLPDERDPLEITSPTNAKVKRLVDLRRRKIRKRDGVTVLEGRDELAVALDAGGHWTATVRHQPRAVPAKSMACEDLGVEPRVLDRQASAHERLTGIGGAIRGRSPGGPVRLPQLHDPEVDIRVLGTGPRLRYGTQGERPARPQRAPARHDARLPQLRRLRAVELRRLGDNEGRRVDEGQRMEVRLRHELPEGQDERHLLHL